MTATYREPRIVWNGWTAPPGTGIVVTGAASGMGAALSILAAMHGMKVSGWDMNVDGVNETIERAGEFGENITPVKVDLASDESVETAMAESIAWAKPLYMANVAGPISVFWKGSFDGFVTSSLGLIARACEAFIASEPGEGAAVVNVGAVWGSFAFLGKDFYAAAKAGIAGYTCNKAVTMKGRIRFNTICPGGTHTPRNHKLYEGKKREEMMQWDSCPLHRPGRPEEIAAAMLFLLSPASSYVNGSVWAVDGGSSLVGA